MKVGFVLPRYGREIHGGAETAARLLAERLRDLPGWSVEVFSTCARDAVTWADDYAPGTGEVDGIKVNRFRSLPKDVAAFDKRCRAVSASPESLSDADALRWVEMQGPVSPGLVEAAEASDCDIVTFHPYLYWPTVEGVARLGPRSVLHPATHDEFPIRLSVFRRVFDGAGGRVFWTDEERGLAERLFPSIAAAPQIVLGIGVENHDGDSAAARAALGLGDRPYLLCLGKVTEMKGTSILARFFATWKERMPGPAALVIAGPVADGPPPHPDVIVTGSVDEATKWGLLRGAHALVSPSAYESLSLVVLEAWSVGTPVLVNGACATTRRHCTLSGGGLWFEGFGTFEVAVERLLADEDLRSALGAAGNVYVEERYRWPAVLRRYTSFLERVAERCRKQPRSVGEAWK